MEIQFLQTLPKVQNNASQHHPNLCDNLCAMFFCDTSGPLYFSIFSGNMMRRLTQILICLWSQRLEKMEKDEDPSAKEIVKNVF